MESFESTGWILIIGAIVLGCVIALVLRGRKATMLSAQLVQSQLALAQATNQNQESQSEIKRLNSSLHEKEVLEGKLQTQLTGAEATEKRLNAELVERKHELDLLSNKLNEVGREHNETGKKLESAQADGRSQIEQIKELRGRLVQTEDVLKVERNEVNRLKEQLAQEGKRSESLESKIEESRKHFA
jgi:DNA recombination protein RmuC